MATTSKLLAAGLSTIPPVAQKDIPQRDESLCGFDYGPLARSLDQIGLPKTAITIVDLTLRIFDKHSMTQRPKRVKAFHHHDHHGGGDPLS